MLMHIGGLYRSSTPVYIELDLRTISKPIKRIIPRPRIFNDPKVSQNVLEPLRIPEENLFREEFTKTPPLQDRLPPKTPEPIRMPELPEIKGIDIATWEGKTSESISPKGDTAKTEQNIRLEAVYMNQVGQMISAKAGRLYRKKAKKRQLQGRTVVQVVIGDNGVIVSTRVAESSNHRMLDQIALKAVRDASPFPKPPRGLTTLDIPINFKLI
jgi:protein TonB